MRERLGVGAMAGAIRDAFKLRRTSEFDDWLAGLRGREGAREYQCPA